MHDVTFLIVPLKLLIKLIGIYLTKPNLSKGLLQHRINIKIFRILSLHNKSSISGVLFTLHHISSAKKPPGLRASTARFLSSVAAISAPSKGLGLAAGKPKMVHTAGRTAGDAVRG